MNRDDLQVGEVLFGIFLFFSFVLSESENACLLYILFKKKFNGSIGNWLKVITVANSLTGICLVLPPCITMIDETWLKQELICQIQGYLGNVFLSTTSLLLLCQAVERYAVVKGCRCERLDRYYGRLMVAMFPISCIAVGFVFMREDPISYIPGYFSCGITKTKLSITISTITLAIPCLLCILISVLVIYKVHCNEGNLVEADFTRDNSLASGHLHFVQPSRMVNEIYRQRNNNTPRISHLKRSIMVISYLQVLLATIIFIIFILDHLMTTTHEKLYNTRLFLTSLTCLLQPSIVLIICRPIRKRVDEILCSRQRTIDSTIEPFSLTSSVPMPRVDTNYSNILPRFLNHGNGLNIEVQVASDTINENATKDDTRRHTIGSNFSYDFNIKPRSQTRESEQTGLTRQVDERLSIRSSITSTDTVFVRINTSIQRRLPFQRSSQSSLKSNGSHIFKTYLSIENLTDMNRPYFESAVSTPDQDFPRRHTRPILTFQRSSQSSLKSNGSHIFKTYLSIENLTDMNRPYFESAVSTPDQDFPRRHTRPILSYNMVHKILPQVWVSEHKQKSRPLSRRHSMHISSASSEHGHHDLPTPVESVASLEYSPPISIQSNSSYTRRSSIRTNRLNYCLGKLQEFSLDNPSVAGSNPELSHS